MIVAVADLLGYAIYNPINILRKTALSFLNIKEILVIRTAYLGDVIMTLPILKPLKESYPRARISFLTSSKAKEVLENNPYIDEILIYDAFWFYPNGFKRAVKDYLTFLQILRFRRYDLVIEARADIRDILLLAYLSKNRYRVSYKVGGGACLLTHIVPFQKIKHKVDYHLDIARRLNCKIDCVEWNIYLTKSEEQQAEHILTKKGGVLGKPIVAIHPGARKELKRWSGSGFATVADALTDSLNASVILAGGPDEIELVKQIEGMMKNKPLILAGKTTLRELAALLKKCDLFICNDSSPLHIASTIKTPTVAIFGPSKSKETGPYGNIHRVVEKDFPCRFTCDEDVCEHKVYQACMKAITPDDVYNAAMELIK